MLEINIGQLCSRGLWTCWLCVNWTHGGHHDWILDLNWGFIQIQDLPLNWNVDACLEFYDRVVIAFSWFLN